MHTIAGATHGYLCIEAVHFTFNNRQLNCCHWPGSSLGYSYNEFLFISILLVFFLCLCSSVTCGMPVESLRLKVLHVLVLYVLPLNGNFGWCHCGLQFRISS